MDNKDNHKANLKEDHHQETAAGGSSGRILVKLKFPKMPPEEEVVAVKKESPAAAAEAKIGPVSDEATTKTHSCKECGRIFSSGKALGGHMSSAHVQANNKDFSGKKLIKTKSGNKSGSGGCSSSFSDHICVLCPKSFPSKKSLFGHMRCHPERPHRGMDPPLSPPSGHLKINSDEHEDSSSDEDEAAAPTALAASLKSWPTAAKRYRDGPTRPVSDSPPPLSYTTDDTLLSTAHELLKLMSSIQPIPLKSSSGTSSALTITPRMNNNNTIPDFSGENQLTVEDDFGDHHHTRFKKLKICERDDNNYSSSSPRKMEYCNNGKGKQKAYYPPSSRLQPDEIDSDDETCLSAMNDLMNVKLAIESSSSMAAPPPPQPPTSPLPARKIIIQENGNSVSTPQKYTCDVCHRSFKSHQALGGHRSSHNKFKFTVVNTDDLGGENGAKMVKKETMNNEYDQQGRYSYGTRVENDENNSSYVCDVCKKIFTSGQALGGHKRSHSASSSSNSSSPAKAAEAAEEAKAAAEEEESKKLKGQKNVLDFDLNESPDQELEENGGDQVPILYYNDAA